MSVTHDAEVIAAMLRWSEEFVEQPHRVVGQLPVCPFAKAARLNQTIRFVVRAFSCDDPLAPDGGIMTLVADFAGAPDLVTLFVIHPDPSAITSPELDALVNRLNATLLATMGLGDLRAFDAHPQSDFHIGDLYTRRAPYPSFQILSHALLTTTSTSLLGSAYYDRFTPEMLGAVGMPRLGLATPQHLG